MKLFTGIGIILIQNVAGMREKSCLENESLKRVDENYFKDVSYVFASQAMPSYKTHVQFNTLLALPLAAAGIYYVYTPPVSFLFTFIGAFLYGTYFMTPDLDLIHQVNFFSLRGLLTLPFRFYSKIFKHRGLSHSVLFGTATRVLWLCAVSLLLFYLVSQTLPSQKKFLFHLNDYKFYGLYGLAGVVLADWCHIALDHIHS